LTALIIAIAFIAYAIAGLFPAGFPAPAGETSGGGAHPATAPLPTHSAPPLDDPAGVIPNRILLTLKDGYGAKDAERLAEAVNGQVLHQYDLTPTYLIGTEDKTWAETARTLKILESRPATLHAEPDRIITLD